MSGISRSTTGSRDTSRETSPTRTPGISRYRRSSDRPPISPATRPVMAQKILQQSREAESALADALVSIYIFQTHRYCSVYVIVRESSSLDPYTYVEKEKFGFILFYGMLCHLVPN